ncbi:FAS-associated death domain protein FAS-associating death domain-containing protein FADD [Channa argus]|uniref:FAS-associated death domain protein FAS-associating death domain-containing protein FADD n=1 Tax=Channa argus TaxID=215402 RepID=A0A6G1P9M1_CHAAH|nr:FAS-associated death domain protein FAS-associating death domain-containing protein FADD [Channa argus]KAK2919644.1 hypothetical protein Q8A73_001848 [Channa argus]
MSCLEFNAVLLDISNQLSVDNLETLKFLCREMIGKKDREKINSGIKLFQLLTERGKLGPQNTEFVSACLREAQRQDLADKLTSFETQSANTNDEPDDTEKAKLDIATQVIAENLVRGWRKVGRKLGVKDVKLESISHKHPSDVEETVVELLKEWRKSVGAEAQTQKLIEVLRACQFNLTADKVEDKLKENGY